MTLLYNFGLTAGSLMAYVLEFMLNPVDPHEKIIQAVTENATLSTTTLPTATVTMLSTIIPSVASTISNMIGNNTLQSNNR